MIRNWRQIIGRAQRWNTSGTSAPCAGDHDPRDGDALMREARVHANRRASREGAPMFIFEGVRLAGRHPGTPERVVYVRSEAEGAPAGAALVEVVGLHDGMRAP